MAGGTQYGIDAEIRLEPTFSQPGFVDGTVSTELLKRATEALLQDKTLGERIRGDMLSVQVQNQLGNAAASFSIDLAPRKVYGDLTWAQIIQPYSLITIALHRRGNDAASTASPEPVLLGLVDYAQTVEDFSQNEPRRVDRIVGRALSSVLNDHHWWYHHFLAGAGGVVQIPPDMREFYEVRPNREALREEVNLRDLGFLAIDLDLYKNVQQRHPVAFMAKTFEFFVGAPASTIGNVQDGFIKLRFADGRPLKERLIFNAGAALAGHHDQGARLSGAFIPTEMPQASCWTAMQHFAEQPFTEFFTDTYGTTIDDALVQVVARKPPWAGHVTYKPDPAVGFSTGSAPGQHQSLFDTAFGEWDIHKDTVEVSGDDIEYRALRRGVVGQGGMYNFYEVRPAGSPSSGNNRGDQVMQQLVPPLIDENPRSPSFIRRYGVRPFRHRTKYIAIVDTDDDGRLEGADLRRHALSYAALVHEWMFRAPEFWSGQYRTKGITGLRVGRRLVDTDLNREYYITGVTHSMSLTSERPSFSTTTQVSRGWDLG